MISTPVFQLDAWKKRRPSFTLVELLIVVAIIGIMIGMVMYTLAGAQRDALNAKTQATIRKLNDIVLYRWEQFRYRAVRTNIPDAFLEPYASPDGQMQLPISPREGARIRMMILRDTMRMELPDRYSDILYTPSIYKVAVYTADNVPPYSDTSNDRLLSPLPSREVPGPYNNFRRKMVSGGAIGTPYGGTVRSLGTLIPTPINQSAELLYEIVATSNYNGTNGLEFFRPSEIGDVDNDGFPEFLDGWGRPIRWLRWPAGYGHVNPANSPDPLSNQTEIDSARPPDWQLNDHSVPDALDPLRTDWRWSLSKFPADAKPWLLVPLIISAGPDGMYDIEFDVGTGMDYATTQWPGPTDSPAHMSSGPYYFIDPYFGFYNNASGATWQGGIGQWFDEDQSKATYGAADNITNYALILE